MKICQVLQEEETVKLYRGISEPNLPNGTKINSRPRQSVFNGATKGLAMSLWDNVIMKHIPQLENTAPRSNCIIATTIINHAYNFGGNVYQIVPQNNTNFVWCKDDFNAEDETEEAIWKIGRILIELGYPVDVVGFNQLISDVQNNQTVQTMWRLETQSKLGPQEYLIDVVRMAFQHNIFGVCSQVHDIPLTATEVWFGGSAEIVDFMGDLDDWARNW